jgi:hypothetical protein
MDDRIILGYVLVHDPKLELCRKCKTREPAHDSIVRHP